MAPSAILLAVSIFLFCVLGIVLAAYFISRFERTRNQVDAVTIPISKPLPENEKSLTRLKPQLSFDKS